MAPKKRRMLSKVESEQLVDLQKSQEQFMVLMMQLFGMMMEVLMQKQQVVHGFGATTGLGGSSSSAAPPGPPGPPGDPPAPSSGSQPMTPSGLPTTLLARPPALPTFRPGSLASSVGPPPGFVVRTPGLPSTPGPRPPDSSGNGGADSGTGGGGGGGSSTGGHHGKGS